MTYPIAGTSSGSTLPKNPMKNLIAVLLLSACAFAQGGVSSNAALKSTGQPAGGATVRVCASTATGTPCSPLASIYSDSALSISKANPTTSDTYGNYAYFAAPGLYKEQVTVGTVTHTNYVIVPMNASNSPTISLTSSYAFTNTATTDYVNNWRLEQGWNPAADSTLYQFGQTTELFTYTANSRAISGIPTAVYGSFNHFGSGAISSGYAGSFEAFNAGSATATLIVGINGSANNGGVAAGTPTQTPTNNGSATHLRGVVGIVKNLSSGTVTNASALYASTPVNSGGGTITNAYGLNVPDQAIGTNNWAIKTGLGTVEFGDNVLLDKGIGVGTALPDNAQSVLIQPNATLTGTTQIGIKTLPKTSAAATTFGIGTYSRADTLNASFSQSNNAGFYAANPTKGASSTITNAFGLYVEDITVGGTKNRAIFTAGAAISEFDGGIQLGTSGTTIADSRKLIQATYDCGTGATCANTTNNSDWIVRGTIALGSASPSASTVASISPAFTSTSTYTCTASPEGATAAIAAGGIAITKVSGSSITLTGPNTVTTVVDYVCIGH
jgi:hypothetical protein